MELLRNYNEARPTRFHVSKQRQLVYIYLSHKVDAGTFHSKKIFIMDEISLDSSLRGILTWNHPSSFKQLKVKYYLTLV